MYWARALLASTFLWPSAVLAQSPGTFIPDQQVTATQLNNALSVKADAHAGILDHATFIASQQLFSTTNSIDATDTAYAGGMKCNGSNDDTAALQAAIIDGDMNHTKRRVMIPGGDCRITGVTIHAPVWIQCPGPDLTTFDLIPGTANPYFKLAITSSDYNVSFGPFIYVTIQSCGWTSASRTDAAGAGVAHGFSVHGADNTTPATVIVQLLWDKIANTPGDCIHYDQTGGGTVKFNYKAWGTTCELPGGNGVFCNSSTDWQWHDGQVWGALQNNFNINGCVNMQIWGVNTFSATLNDIQLFNSSMSWKGGVIDTTTQHNITINNTGGQPLDLQGVWLRWPGGGATNSYSNINFQGTNTGSVYCSQCRFENPTEALPGSGNVPRDAIHFVAGNTGNLYADGSTRVEGQDILNANSTNSAGNIFGSAGQQQFPTSQYIISAKQFDGWRLNNGTNQVAAITGTSVTNDSGALQLLSGGTTMTNLQANATGKSFPFTMGATALSQNPATLGFNTRTASGAPGAAGAIIELVCGTGAGTAKLVARAGTSGTAVTIVDNIGAGVTGC